MLESCVDPTTGRPPTAAHSRITENLLTSQHGLTPIEFPRHELHFIEGKWKNLSQERQQRGMDVDMWRQIRKLKKAENKAQEKIRREAEAWGIVKRKIQEDVAVEKMTRDGEREKAKALKKNSAIEKQAAQDQQQALEQFEALNVDDE